MLGSWGMHEPDGVFATLGQLLAFSNVSLVGSGFLLILKTILAWEMSTFLI